MCAKPSYVHVIVPQSRFRITKGTERLAEYTFHTRVAKHLFCADCGIKSFYRPRSNPDGWSVNAHCLDNTDGVTLQIDSFDGQNWEANADGLAHLSQEPA